jgi:NADPH-dependent glutamate synthase beta subunit-like oxidoreductase
LKKQPWRFGLKCKIRVSLIVWAIAEGRKMVAGIGKNLLS